MVLPQSTKPIFSLQNQLSFDYPESFLHQGLYGDTSKGGLLNELFEIEILLEAKQDSRVTNLYRKIENIHLKRKMDLDLRKYIQDQGFDLFFPKLASFLGIDGRGTQAYSQYLRHMSIINQVLSLAIQLEQV